MAQCLLIKKLNCSNCSDLHGILLKGPDVLSKIIGSALGLQESNATGQEKVAGSFFFLHTLYLVFVKFIKLISSDAPVIVAISGSNLNMLMQHSEAALRIMSPVTVYAVSSHCC
jgi:hypothetical protein